MTIYIFTCNTRREWHFVMLHRMIAGGYDKEFPLTPESVDEKDQMEACLRCHRMFPTRAAWSVLAFRAHGVKNKVRQLVGGSRCDACAREYNTPTRLQHHLNHSHSCYARLLMVGEIYDGFLPAKNNTKEIPMHRFGLPPLCSEGPTEKRLTDVDDELRDIHDWELLENIFDPLVGLPSDASFIECVDAIKQTLADSCTSLRDTRRTLWYCVE